MTLGGDLNRVQIWSLAGGATALAVIASIEFVDVPVARLSYGIFGRSEFLRKFADAPRFFWPLAALVILAFLARRLLRRPFSHADAVLALCAISEGITAALLFPLKHLFGRTWPLYGRPSLLVDGAYGFNPLRSGSDYHAFPSGHTAAICAVAGVFWAAYPSFRPLCAGIVVAAAVPLILGDFHFVSDVIAGGLLGASVSALCFKIFNRAGPKISD